MQATTLLPHQAKKALVHCISSVGMMRDDIDHIEETLQSKYLLLKQKYTVNVLINKEHK